MFRMRRVIRYKHHPSFCQNLKQVPPPLPLFCWQVIESKGCIVHMRFVNCFSLWPRELLMVPQFKLLYQLFMLVNSSCYCLCTDDVLKKIILSFCIKMEGFEVSPLYKAIGYWWSQSCSCSLRILNTAMTVPILLLVRLPSAAKRRWSLLPLACTVLFIPLVDNSWTKTAFMSRLTPSPFLACGGTKY